jgi:hypothetical protein
MKVAMLGAVVHLDATDTDERTSHPWDAGACLSHLSQS